MMRLYICALALLSLGCPAWAEIAERPFCARMVCIACAADSWDQDDVFSAPAALPGAMYSAAPSADSIGQRRDSMSKQSYWIVLCLCLGWLAASIIWLVRLLRCFRQTTTGEVLRSHAKSMEQKGGEYR